jgi:hypothetical protein
MAKIVEMHSRSLWPSAVAKRLFTGATSHIVVRGAVRAGATVPLDAENMPFIRPDKMEASYETVVIGSGSAWIKSRRGGRTLLSSVLPTCGSAPPSLTIAAMSLARTP